MRLQSKFNIAFCSQVYLKDNAISNLSTKTGNSRRIIASNLSNLSRNNQTDTVVIDFDKKNSSYYLTTKKKENNKYFISVPTKINNIEDINSINETYKETQYHCIQLKKDRFHKFMII